MKKRHSPTIEKIFYDPKKMKDNTKLLSSIETVLKLSTAPFTRQKTTSTATYITPTKIIKVIPKNDELSGYACHFIGKVKKYFSEKPLPEKISNDRPYYEYFRPISTYQNIKNVVEIDLNAAYWTAALNLGYISEDFYNEAFDERVSKLARIVATGSLGKKTVTTEFKHPYNDFQHVESYDRNRVFWDNIVYTVGEVMREVVSHYKVHVFGMWFDAFFCDKSVAESIRKFMLRRGYPVKTKAIESYIVEPSNNIVAGAKITRVYANGEVVEEKKKKKVMLVNYIPEEQKQITFEQFLKVVAKGAYL